MYDIVKKIIYYTLILKPSLNRTLDALAYFT